MMAHLYVKTKKKVEERIREENPSISRSFSLLLPWPIDQYCLLSSALRSSGCRKASLIHLSRQRTVSGRFCSIHQSYLGDGDINIFYHPCQLRTGILEILYGIIAKLLSIS